MEVIFKKLKKCFKKYWFILILIASIFILGIVLGSNYVKNGFIVLWDNNFVEFNDEHEWVWSFILSCVSLFIAAVTVLFLWRSTELTREQLEKTDEQLKMTRETIEDSFFCVLNIVPSDKSIFYYTFFQNDDIHLYYNFCFSLISSEEKFAKLIYVTYGFTDQTQEVFLPLVVKKKSCFVYNPKIIIDNNNLSLKKEMTKISGNFSKKTSVFHNLIDKFLRKPFSIDIKYKDKKDNNYNLHLEYKVSLKDRRKINNHNVSLTKNIYPVFIRNTSFILKKGDDIIIENPYTSN